MGRCHFIFLGTFNASLNECGLSFCIARAYSRFNKSQIRKSDVPKALVETVRVMNQRHLDVRARMVELSRVNWEILKLEVPEKGVAGRRKADKG
jgi:hypothetical protein